jgi:hypothetical protein
MDNVRVRRPSLIGRGDAIIRRSSIGASSKLGLVTSSLPGRLPGSLCENDAVFASDLGSGSRTPPAQKYQDVLPPGNVSYTRPEVSQSTKSKADTILARLNAVDTAISNVGSHSVVEQQASQARRLSREEAFDGATASLAEKIKMLKYNAQKGLNMEEETKKLMGDKASRRNSKESRSSCESNSKKSTGSCSVSDNMSYGGFSDVDSDNEAEPAILIRSAVMGG